MRNKLTSLLIVLVIVSGCSRQAVQQDNTSRIVTPVLTNSDSIREISTQVPTPNDGKNKPQSEVAVTPLQNSAQPTPRTKMSKLNSGREIKLLWGVPRSETRKAHPNWTSYTHSNSIYDIKVNGNTVWAATDGGLVKWDTSTNTYTKFTGEHGLLDHQLRSVALGYDGSVWVGSDQGYANKMDLSGNWSNIKVFESGSSRNILSIRLFPDGSAWFDGRPQQILRPEGKWEDYKPSSVDMGFRAVAADGSIWFIEAYDQGIGKRAPDGKFSHWDTTKGLLSNEVSDIAVAPDGSAWLAYGFNDKIEGTVTQLKPDGTITNHIIADSSILAIDFGPDGSLWYGGVGLGHIDSRDFETLYLTNDGFNLSEVVDIAVAPDGSTWFMDSFGYASHLKTYGSWDDQNFRKLFPSNDIDLSVITVGPDGTIWLGTQQNGVGRLEPDGQFFTYTVENGLVSNRAHKIAVQANGTVWVVHDSGVSQMNDGKTWHKLSIDNDFATTDVTDIKASSDGSIWLSSNSTGVARLDANGTWHIYTAKDGLASNKVLAIALKSDGTVFFANPTAISELKSDGTWQIYTYAQSVYKYTVDTSVGYVPGMIVSADGSLWVGLAGYESVVNRLDTNGQWTTYTRESGLAGNSIRSLVLGNDGSVLIGYDEGGASRFQP